MTCHQPNFTLMIALYVVISMQFDLLSMISIVTINEASTWGLVKTELAAFATFESKGYL